METKKFAQATRSKAKSSPSEKVAKINKVIQARLRLEKINECTPIQATEWLEAKGLLPSDKGRPGRPLRILLRKGLIKGAKQEGAGRRWIICRVKL